MKQRELSKQDFEVLDEALAFYINSKITVARAEKLKDLFAKAHTGFLEIEEE